MTKITAGFKARLEYVLVCADASDGAATKCAGSLRKGS
jgi:hypothetical protein